MVQPIRDNMSVAPSREGGNAFPSASTDTLGQAVAQMCAQKLCCARICTPYPPV